MTDIETWHSGSGDVTVQELTCALVDGQIDSGEFQLLESMLLSDDAARREYLECMQLHTDLLAHFAKPAGVAADGKSPVLGFLGGGVPPLDAQTAQQ
jgi:anti-sigma factor RsiW